MSAEKAPTSSPVILETVFCENGKPEYRRSKSLDSPIKQSIANVNNPKYSEKRKVFSMYQAHKPQIVNINLKPYVGSFDKSKDHCIKQLDEENRTKPEVAEGFPKKKNLFSCRSVMCICPDSLCTCPNENFSYNLSNKFSCSGNNNNKLEVAGSFPVKMGPLQSDVLMCTCDEVFCICPSPVFPMKASIKLTNSERSISKPAAAENYPNMTAVTRLFKRECDKIKTTIIPECTPLKDICTCLQHTKFCICKPVREPSESLHKYKCSNCSIYCVCKSAELAIDSPRLCRCSPRTVLCTCKTEKSPIEAKNVNTCVCPAQVMFCVCNPVKRPNEEQIKLFNLCEDKEPNVLWLCRNSTPESIPDFPVTPDDEIFVDSDLFRVQRPEIKTYMKKCRSSNLDAQSKIKEATSISKECSEPNTTEEEHNKSTNMTEEEPIESTNKTEEEPIMSTNKTEKITKESTGSEKTNILPSIAQVSPTIRNPQYRPGELLWGRIGRHPFWPCIVINEPHKSIHMRQIAKRLQVHVHYFADNGRRSWLYSGRSMIFLGLQHFFELARNFKEPAGLKKKNPYVIRSSILTTWNQAVEEAEKMLSLPRLERIQVFQDMCPKENLAKKTHKADDAEEVDARPAKMRKLSQVEGDTCAKDILKATTQKIKPKNSQKGKNCIKNGNICLLDEKLTPHNKRKGKNVHGEAFSSFAEIHESSVRKEYPEYSDRMVHNYLMNKWKKSGDSFFEKTDDRMLVRKSLSSEKIVEKKEPEKQATGSSSTSGEKVKTEATLDSRDLSAPPVRTRSELFRGLRNEKVCVSCYAVNSVPMIHCKTCEAAHHTTCVKSLNNEWECQDCKMDSHFCFVCKTKESPLDIIRCNINKCGKFYHISCLSKWPQATPYPTLKCPMHTCHTCVSCDPTNANKKFFTHRVVRCIFCPTAYHVGDHCVPAGTTLLTSSQMICVKHSEEKEKGGLRFNASWCFLCSTGGSLICCDSCPSSFHPDCLKIAPPTEDESFNCEDCNSGRFPLYGEVVWVKLGSYRWWPAQIVLPSLVPENVSKIAHRPGEYVVRYFGSKDFSWTSNRRCFPYEDGDRGNKANAKKAFREGVFEKAVGEAKKAHDLYTAEKKQRASRRKQCLKPPAYAKIQTNRLFGSLVNQKSNALAHSQATPCECDPLTDNPCGADSSCINRMLLVECNPSSCPAGVRCCNQQFEKRKYPSLSPFPTEHRGWGLKTLEDLRKGVFIIEYVGELIDTTELKDRIMMKSKMKDENYYFLTVDKDRVIDAGRKGNMARFMNHSCMPNCETQKWTVNGVTRIGIFACQEIPANTELTFNYMLETVGTEKMPCLCGASKCVGLIGEKVKPAEEEKVKSSSKVSRGKKRKLSAHSTNCFLCGHGGIVFECGEPDCTKSYHLKCVTKKEGSDLQRGKWHCPLHKCNQCQAKATSHCSLCTTSYCQRHGTKKFITRKGNGGHQICKKHDI